MTKLTPNAVLATDLVILTVSEGTLRVLLQPRPESEDLLALPGVLLREDESDLDGVRRTLSTKLGGADFFLEQIRTFADPARDHRGRVASIAWGALVPPLAASSVTGQSRRLLLADLAMVDGRAVAAVGGSPCSLAFDHDRILDAAMSWLRSGLGRTLSGAEFLQPEFTLRDLQSVYEAVHGKRIAPSNFHAYATRPGRGIVPTGGTAPTNRPGKPGRLYRAEPATGNTPWDTER